MAEEATVVNEGKAEVFTPAHVFYNPVQEFNRDLTIAVISEHVCDHFKNLRAAEEKRKSKQKIDDDSVVQEENKELNDPVEAGVKYEHGVKILEALSASGLRSIRFALEIPGVKAIITNDFDENAVGFIRRNVAHNNVSDLVTPSCADASMVMYQNRKMVDRFDVIDLDPYGTAAPFLDAAVQALKDGGLLCVTCTDMAVLAGNAPETCHAKYQAMSLRAKFCHEQALRILLQCVDSHANRYSRYIVPLISISADFYVRIFLRIYSGQNQVKHSVTKLSMVYHCVSCGNFKLQPLAHKTQTSETGSYKFTPAHAPVVSPQCTVCGGRQQMGGPMWSDPIHDQDFVRRVISRVEQQAERFGTSDRVRGVLSVVSEELPHAPLYYVSDELSKIVHCNPMKTMELRSAILNAGYEVSFSHAHKNSLKTTAPVQVIWDIFRCWIKKNPVKESRLQDGTLAKTILSTEATIEADFTEHPDANPASRKNHLLRWQQNPEKDWGPKARATKGQNADIDIRRKKGSEKAKEKKRKVTAAQQEIDLKQFQCKRLREGICDLGEDCKYSHSTGLDASNPENMGENNTDANNDEL